MAVAEQGAKETQATEESVFSSLVTYPLLRRGRASFGFKEACAFMGEFGCNRSSV